MDCASFFIFRAALFLTLAATLAPGLSRAQPGQRSKLVLVLHSYHQGFTWTGNVQRGIESVLESSPGLNADMVVEYLDSKSHPPKSVFPLYLPLFEGKYSVRKPDVIICSDDNALNFLLANRDRAVPGVPVVFCGINDYAPSRTAGHKGYTGVAEVYDIPGTVEVALKLHPKARHLAVISDSTETGDINLKRFREAAPLFKGRVDIIELAGLSAPELAARLGALPPDTVILNLSFFRDKDGAAYSPREAGRFIASASNLPVYAPWDFFMEGDVVGGRVVSGYEQGAEAARMALRILGGTPAEDIPPVLESPNRFMFDYGPLTRAGVDMKDLPKGSVVLNEPQSFYRRYTVEIWFAASLFASMAVMMALMGLVIIQKRRAQRELTLALAELQSVFDNSLMGILVLRDGRRIFRANQRMAEILGYPKAEDLIGMNARALHLSDENFHEFGLLHYNTLVLGDNLHVDYQLRKHNGEPFWATLSGRALDTARPPDLDKGVLWIIDDLSERKKAEGELRALKNQLRDILNSIPSAIIAVDMEGTVIQWSSQAGHVCGHTAESALGRHVEAVCPGLPEPWSAMRERVARKLPLRYHKIPVVRDCQARYTDITVSPLAAGGLSGAVIRIDDVTERVRLEEMLVQSEKMNSVGELAAGMAHEINNPLAGIIQSGHVAVNRLRKKLPANEEAARKHGLEQEAVLAYLEERGIMTMLDNMVSAGRRAAGIVSNMLSFCRKTDSGFAPADLAGVFDKALEIASNDYDLKKKFDFKNIEIVREIDPCTPPAPCQSGQIQQVFFNLLKNAAQAMGPSDAPGFKPRITFRAAPDGGMVRVEIADNGPGMEETVRRRVFEPFYTTKPVGEGTGLGLSVSYFIITETHRGTIEVDSKPGMGTAFIIRLPLAE